MTTKSNALIDYTGQTIHGVKVLHRLPNVFEACGTPRTMWLCLLPCDHVIQVKGRTLQRDRANPPRCGKCVEVKRKRTEGAGYGPKSNHHYQTLKGSNDNE